MGGKALEPFGARRYEREEYIKAMGEVLDLLKDLSPEQKVAVIPWYAEKSSFGDLDVLVLPLTSAQYDEIKKAFGSSPCVKNGDVLSILYQQLQVDIIPMQEENFMTAYWYYSYNDLGNLLGRLFHKFGLKYGHRGLTMPMKDGDNQYHEIVVSKAQGEIYKFLGLDFKETLMRFKNLEEIYKFVVSSKYFSPEPFQYENLNHTNRIRDRKRSTYRGFLEYVANLPPRDWYEFKNDKAEYLPLIFDSFPGIKEEYKKAQAQLEHRLKVKAHFNGALVQEWLSIEGNLLGQFLKWLKNTRGEFRAWVMDLDQTKLKETIVIAYDQFMKEQRVNEDICQ